MQELIVVSIFFFLSLPLLVSTLFLGGVDVVLSHGVLIQVLELPNAALHALVHLGVGLLDDDDVGQLVLTLAAVHFVVVQLLHV